MANNRITKEIKLWILIHIIFKLFRINAEIQNEILKSMLYV